ncbi:hypothetical protein TSUD_193220 [Trifolium subterraneum]|uniref:Uncharacterized protein n=1 Tax=Trifolium subterraneum TaxID=3900 RepID=A0A2Z6LMP4_TRISU|nr:hypothetical protein TSUD_193220 [Trifolium subterraneum]
MDMRADKDKKFNIAYTTLSDLEKYQKCDAELARHLMTRMEKSTLSSKHLNWAKAAQTKVIAKEKLRIPKTVPSISSSNKYFFGQNFVDRVLLLKIAMIGKLQLDELKSWLGSHWGCVDGSMPASANNPLDIAGVQLVASFSFATCEQILWRRFMDSNLNRTVAVVRKVSGLGKDNKGVNEALGLKFSDKFSAIDNLDSVN